MQSTYRAELCLTPDVHQIPTRCQGLNGKHVSTITTMQHCHNDMTYILKKNLLKQEIIRQDLWIYFFKNKIKADPSRKSTAHSSHSSVQTKQGSGCIRISYRWHIRNTVSREKPKDRRLSDRKKPVGCVFVARVWAEMLNHPPAGARERGLKSPG